MWRPTLSGKAEGNIGREADSAGVIEQGTLATGFPESWEISPTPTSGGTAEREGNEARQEVGEKSERSVVAMNQGNRSRRDPEERRERRNVEPSGGKMSETSDSEIVSTKTERIVKLARQAPDMVIKTLAHHMDMAWLREAHRRTRKRGAVGVDGQTAEEYARQLESNLARLLEQAKSGSYRAPPVKRVHIPKDNGQSRPLGIPTFEDKVLQRAIAMLLEAVYEQDFLDCSYGFRPGRSAHQALTTLRDTLMEMGGGWVIEVDIRNYFGSIDHHHLREALGQRIGDGVVLRLIGKWLNAGVMEEGELSYPESGTPQGGVISPLLANVYLHVVLDMWFEREVKPRLGGKAKLVRFADDFVIVFEQETDARRVYEVLSRRFAKFGLQLHPEKTRLVPFKRPPPSKDDDGRRGVAQETFALLGFQLFWGKSERGYWVIKVETAPSRFTRTLRRLSEWCRTHRHRPVAEQWKKLSRALVGHFNYFGVVGNAGRLLALSHEVYGTWRRWLNRRSQRSRMTWAKMRLLHQRYPLPKLPAVLRPLRS
jgi:group II intron reverse transcriptase/maturase